MGGNCWLKRCEGVRIRECDDQTRCARVELGRISFVADWIAQGSSEQMTIGGRRLWLS